MNSQILVEFHKIIDECRPGTLDAERPALILCMSKAAELGIKLLGHFIRDLENVKPSGP